MEKASGPDSRITAMPPVPLGVETAVMVEEFMWFRIYNLKMAATRFLIGWASQGKDLNSAGSTAVPDIEVKIFFHFFLYLIREI